MEIFIIILVLIAIVFSLGSKINEKSENRGEAAVREVLTKYCKQSTAHVLNNVTLKYKDGTTQIDHILITQKGILVIETKNYSGWLFANENQKYWTQILFKVKNKFQNPIFQNNKHVNAVQKTLGFLPKNNILGLVVFTGSAEFKTDIPKSVIKLHQLKEYIELSSFASISENRVQFCVGRLECIRLELTGKTDVEHQEYLQRKFGKID